MTRREYLKALDALHGSFDSWNYDRERKRYTAKVDDLTLTVDYREGHAEYMAEHADYGVITNGWQLSDVISHARREVVEFTRAWVNITIAESVIPV